MGRGEETHVLGARLGGREVVDGRVLVEGRVQERLVGHSEVVALRVLTGDEGGAKITTERADQEQGALEVGQFGEEHARGVGPDVA